MLLEMGEEIGVAGHADYSPFVRHLFHKIKFPHNAEAPQNYSAALKTRIFKPSRHSG